MSDSLRLNLGCGRDIREGWINVDRQALPGVDKVIDLHDVSSWWAVDTVDEMLLSHVIEHVDDVLEVMEELWRVARPGCRLTVRCPHGASNDADEDPTHVRRMFPASFAYFGQPAYHLADYGYRGDWQVESCVLWMDRSVAEGFAGPEEAIRAVKHMWNTIVEMEVVLVAVKPAREPVVDRSDNITAEIKVR